MHYYLKHLLLTLEKFSTVIITLDIPSLFLGSYWQIGKMLGLKNHGPMESIFLTVSIKKQAYPVRNN